MPSSSVAARITVAHESEGAVPQLNQVDAIGEQTRSGNNGDETDAGSKHQICSYNMLLEKSIFFDHHESREQYTSDVKPTINLTTDCVDKNGSDSVS